MKLTPCARQENLPPKFLNDWKKLTLPGTSCCQIQCRCSGRKKWQASIKNDIERCVSCRLRSPIVSASPRNPSLVRLKGGRGHMVLRIGVI
ncbi:hypothetical protein CEP51_001623 [Fusarium floridanum]|uniref:Uncharacterized protein n=1 Tax=Fusarium floridanum TaxID=1325733 RepID=A0A428SFW6_9HYPO|nr:hypothetical protein CEP51_001623 [Fusarium floridanum]